MDNFKLVAPYLSHPLVLIGFSLFLLLGLFTTLVKSGIVPQLTKKASKEVVHKILTYGFITSVLIILSGFVSNMANLFVSGHTPVEPVEAPLIPKTNPMPFDVGWVFVGYYNPQSQSFTDGGYLQLTYRTDTSKKDDKTPVIGDVYHVTKDRNVVIKNYKVDGLRNQFVSPLRMLNKPNDKVAILTDNDYTEVVIPKNTLVVVSEADVSDVSPNGLFAVWALVRTCHPDILTCQEAVRRFERDSNSD